MAEKTLHIAWTVDDGPTPYTNAMIKVFTSKKIPATWYIQRNKLTNSQIPTYLNLQNAKGHEIAIHGIHAKRDHLSWFPSKKKPSYASINEALDDLEEFHKELKDAGLKTKFIRVPYGLMTELSHLMSKRGRTWENNAAMQKDVRGVISATNSDKSEAVQQTMRDLRTLKTTIEKLGLHLWGGASSDSISAQSWEAESAAKLSATDQNRGAQQRTDDVPRRQIDMMKLQIPRRPSKSGSFVILCHDTSAKDAKEVLDDIVEMERVAKETGTKIKYYTMSSLFAQLTSSQ